jgi:hypothetical protein
MELADLDTVDAGQTVIGRDAEQQRIRAENPLAQPNHRTWVGRAEPRENHHVQIAAPDLIGAVLVSRGGQPDLQAREALAHAGERSAHDAWAAAERDPHAQQPAHLVRTAVEHGLGGTQLHQNPLGVLDQLAAHRGEGHPPRRALDQPGSRLALERRDLLGDRGARVLQAARRGRDRALAVDRAEHDQLADVEHAVSLPNGMRRQWLL